MIISYVRQIEISAEPVSAEIGVVHGLYEVREALNELSLDASRNGFDRRVEIQLCVGGTAWQHDHEILAKIAKQKTEFEAIFLLAGIPILRMWELPCQYLRKWVDNPWYLVKTSFGLIEIGWRKRVISIDWSDTLIQTEVTSDSVTKGPTHVHAWSNEKAIEYLKVLAVYGLPTISERA